MAIRKTTLLYGTNSVEASLFISRLFCISFDLHFKCSSIYIPRVAMLN